jgi:DNA adenine methylase
MTLAVRRPALRYHGGKWRLAPWIIRHMPAHDRYTESYGGAASVLLRKPRARSEIFNDLDGEVVHFFRTLQNPAQAARLAELLEVTPFARDEWRLAYQPADDPIERARRTIIRSYMGFGSDSTSARRKTGFRSNSSSSRVTGAMDWGRWPAQVPAFVARLRGVLIDHKDARLVMREHDAPETLHYVDPPYVHSTRERGRGYAHEMTDGDHVALWDVLNALEGMVVLSGYRCELYDELYRDWRRIEREVTVFRARRSVECLWLNAATVQALVTEGRLAA